MAVQTMDPALNPLPSMSPGDANRESPRNPAAAGLRAVITGDIVASSALGTAQRHELPEALRAVHREVQRHLQARELYPIDLFGGDSWQIYLSNPTAALAAATLFRSALFADFGLSTRMVIAVDDIDFLNTENLSESDGPAFRRSGRALKKMNGRSLLLLLAESAQPPAQIAASALARTIEHIAASWTRSQAQSIKHVIACMLEDQHCSQAEIGRRWYPDAISQQAVARHLQSAGWSTIEESLNDYTKLIAHAT